MSSRTHQRRSDVPRKTAAPIRWVLAVNLVCYLLVATAVLAALTLVLLVMQGWIAIWAATALAVPFAIGSVPGALLTSVVLLRLASGPEVAARRRGALGGSIVSAVSMASAVLLVAERFRPNTLDIGPIAALLMAMGIVTGAGAGAVAILLRRAYWKAPVYDLFTGDDP